jgi:hypothetical protein
LLKIISFVWEFSEYEYYHDDDIYAERWEQWDESNYQWSERAGAHTALTSRAATECSLCCGTMFVAARLQAPPFDAAFSFKQALLCPRKPVQMARNEDVRFFLLFDLIACKPDRFFSSHLLTMMM